MTAAPPLAQLDQDLRRTQEAVAAAVANVYALYEHPVCRALAGSAHAPPAPLAGASRAPVDAALATVRQLLLRATELQGVVQRAAALREHLPLVFREDALRELDRLLHGPAVPVPAAEVPLWQRGLLADATHPEQALSIGQVLAAMAPAFEEARRTVEAVERAWETLGPQLDAASAEAADLRRVSDGAGLGDAPELQELARRIEAAREAVRLDPLGAARSVAEGIAPALAEARARLAAVAAEQRQAAADFAEAHRLLGEVSEAHAQAVAADAERRLKVALAASSAPVMPPSEEEIAACRAWLAQLDALTADPATRAPARVGVRRWLAAARGHLARAKRASAEGRALLDERLELRGRLDALLAKAAGCALAEDAALSADAQAARGLLYQRPTPMERAREAVGRYQARLNALVAGRDGE